MHSGALRHKIIIQQPAGVRDSNGQMVETWTTFATVWASVEPLQGREFFAADQINSEITTRIRLRYLSGITQDMRISFDSRIYDIRSIIQVREIHHEMQLMCKEGFNNG